jgi:uncharacterized protein YlaN (UPF0358 family)
MPVTKPYPHIYRHGPDRVNMPFFGLYREPQIQHHFAAFEVIKRDLARVLEFVEPTVENLKVYSHRLFELLLRACTEVESLSRLVFAKNGVILGRDGNIIRFSDLEGPMRLSEYIVCSPETTLPDWRPFESFCSTTRNERSPAWYQGYNAAKHDRAGGFAQASLENVLGAVGGVYIMLAAQVGPYFDTNPRLANPGIRPSSRLITHRVLPVWDETEKYDFNWSTLKQSPEPYHNHLIPARP